MTTQLKVTVGQASDKGRKPINQDSHGSVHPPEPQLSAKGVVTAIADGISSSEVSQVASQIAVRSFLEDYYDTSHAWSVKNSAQRVLHATNSWLYSTTRNGPYRYNIEKGYVCTFTALVLKSATAHIFHSGDARVYRIVGHELEQLTEDHRVWQSPEKSYLSRALGMRDGLDLDYGAHAIESGDIFVLATDGVYEFTPPGFVVVTIQDQADDLDLAAKMIVEEALQRGSDDNLTVQIVRVDSTAGHSLEELHERAHQLPQPPELRPRSVFDGYRILRELHHSARSHVYLAEDEDTGAQVAIKVLSQEMVEDEAAVETFLMEEWIARRLDNVHLLKAYRQERARNYLYTVAEYVQGQSLAQWINDHPQPDLESVRDIIEQVGRGLQALHRQEMLHQDLRPNNVMITPEGTVKIIDFGAVRVAGLVEAAPLSARQHILGTMSYTAPEYFIGRHGDSRSDLFSLGVIAYQMLSGGRLPYGTSVARATTRTAQMRLDYQSVQDPERSLPGWVDETLRKAVQPNPDKRYSEVSEFLYDLRHPNFAYLRKEQPPLMERNPLLFWKLLSLALSVTLLILLATHPMVDG